MKQKAISSKEHSKWNPGEIYRGLYTLMMLHNETLCASTDENDVRSTDGCLPHLRIGWVIRKFNQIMGYLPPSGTAEIKLYLVGKIDPNVYKVIPVLGEGLNTRIYSCFQHRDKARKKLKPKTKLKRNSIKLTYEWTCITPIKPLEYGYKQCSN